MTAHIKPDDYPKNMEPLLNRSDFKLIGPTKFHCNFKLRFDACNAYATIYRIESSLVQQTVKNPTLTSL